MFIKSNSNSTRTLTECVSLSIYLKNYLAETVSKNWLCKNKH